MSNYVDINGFDPTNKPVLTGAEVIVQSIYNILNSLQTERLFRPAFPGLELDAYLFEPVSAGTSLDILNIVTNQIRAYEPRVEILFDLSEVTADEERNRYDISLYFKILGFGDQKFSLSGSVGQ